MVFEKQTIYKYSAFGLDRFMREQRTTFTFFEHFHDSLIPDAEKIIQLLVNISDEYLNWCKFMMEQLLIVHNWTV